MHADSLHIDNNLFHCILDNKKPTSLQLNILKKLRAGVKIEDIDIKEVDPFNYTVLLNNSNVIEAHNLPTDLAQCKLAIF